MSGEWIKVEQVLPDKPEVLQLSRILGLSRDEIVGKLFRFWAWWSNHCEENSLDSSIIPLVDDVIGIKGFAEALQAVGWLSYGEQSAWLPNYDRHVSRTAKKRAIDNERKRRQRARDKRKHGDDPYLDAEDVHRLNGVVAQVSAALAAEDNDADDEDIDSDQDDGSTDGRDGVQLGELNDEAADDQLLARTADQDQSQDAPRQEAKGRRRARTKFRAPGVTECRKFGRRHGLSEDLCTKFHRHYQANGWLMGNGNKMGSWHAALLKFAENHRDGPLHTASPGHGRNGRPPNGSAIADAARESPADLAERIAANGL